MSEGFLTKLGPIQHALRRAQLSGWLLADTGHNRVARMLLQSRGNPARRYVFWVPAEGFPITLAHRLDASAVNRFPGEAWEYDGWADFRSKLRKLLPRGEPVAMEYAPMGSHPFLDQVDSGFVELVRSYGVFVTTSGNLLAEFLGPLTANEQDTHREIAATLEKAIQGAVAIPAEGDLPDEQVVNQLQHAMEAELQEQGLVASELRVSLSGADASILNLEVAASGRGSCAEVARTFSRSSQASPEIVTAYHVMHESFQVLHGFLTSRMEQGRRVLAFELDQLVRNHLANHGVQATMDHRLGHAMGGVTPLGEVGLLDSFETIDTRPIHTDTVWALRPSLPIGKSRVMVSANLLVGDQALEWTSLPPRQLPSLFSR